MSKKILTVSNRMKGMLDDDYTLYEDGTLKHFYDKHTYPGGQDITEYITVDDLSLSTKVRIFEDTSDENKSLVKKILKLE